MPPATKKNVSVILFDINCTNKQTANAALLKMLACKHFMSPKDHIHLGVVNSTKSSQDISDITTEPLAGIYEFITTQEIALEKANLHEILQNGISFAKSFEKMYNGIVTPQFILVSDLSNVTAPADVKQLENTAKDANNKGIFVYIVGPPVKHQTIANASKIKTAMEQMNTKDASQVVQMAQKFVLALEKGVLTTFEAGIHLVSSFVNSKEKQAWKVPLTLGTSVKLPTCSKKILEDVRFIKIKKESTSKLIWVDPEDENVEFDYPDVIRGIERHGRFVEMSDGATMFKGNEERSFKLLGFTESKYIPEVYLSKESYGIVTLKGTYSKLLTCLAEILNAENKYAITRRIYAKGNVPKYWVLIPYLSPTPHFNVLTLPYADDVIFEFLDDEPILKTEITNDISSFLTGLTVNAPKTLINLPLTPNMMNDYTENKFINKIANKLVPSVDLQPLDILLEATYHESVEKAKNKFLVREIPKVEDEEDFFENFEDDDDFNLSSF